MRTSQIIVQRSLPQLCGVLLVAAFAILYAMGHLTARLDSNVTEHTQFLIRKAITDTVEKLAGEASGLRVIGQLYGASERPPLPSARQFEAFCEKLGCDGALLISPDGDIVDAFGGQQHLVSRLGSGSGPGIEQMVAQLPRTDNGTGAVAGLVQVGTVPAAIAGLPVDQDAQYPDGSTLLLVDVLAADDLLHLGFKYGVVDLHLADGPLKTGEGSAQLAGLDGRPVEFHWTTPGLAEQSFDALLPVMGVSALVMALLIGLILRDALRAARQLEQQHAALEASQSQLIASETRFRDIAEAASDWLWETDATGTLVYLSERFERVTQYAAEQWLGRALGELLRAESGDVQQWLSAQSPSALRCRYEARTGITRICRLASRPILVDGQCVGYRGTASDITEEVRARNEIEHLSLHDPLTGLPNRNQLRKHLVGQLAAGEPVVMLSLDLDRFKPVNDTLGHAAGDRVLRDISLRLLECTRENDLVARLGGDEFIMVLGGSHTQDSIERLCARLIEQIRQPVIYEDQEIFIGTSIGVALAPQDANEADELLRCADIALYQAKAHGRATWSFYAPEMNERLLQRRQLEMELRHAISHDQLRVHFQPRYRTDGLQMVGAEALVRWQHPQRGLLEAAEFVELAEETGLIIPLGQWVLSEACREATRWPTGWVVSVNLSVVQFRQSDVAGDVQKALWQSRLPAGRLELEVAERILLDESAGALKTLQALKNMGVRLTMDEFGTGYSSLNYLRNYPFDGLKIDRSFVSNMLSSSRDQSIIKAIVGLAQALDIDVTAEGVESKEQLDWLEQQNCKEVQGFHMSRPKSREEMAQLLAGNKAVHR